MDNFSIEALKEKLESMSLEDCANVVKESMTVLYGKLRTEESFGYSMAITGNLDPTWPDVYIINNNETSGGRATYVNTFKL